MATFKWTESSDVANSITGTLVSQSNYNGINLIWKIRQRIKKSDGRTIVYFSWRFEWDELMKQGIDGFEGTITVAHHLRFHHCYPTPTVPGFPKTMPVRLTHSGQRILKYLGSEDAVGKLFIRGDIYFRFDFDLKPIRKYDELRFLEETFAASDRTDAILVVEGKKLHVNKQFLSFHSDYFNTLFNSEFKEKSMDEIPIEDVSYEDFALFLSVVYPNPIHPTVSTSASLLKLADRFMMPMVTRLVEPFLIRSETVRISEKIALADEYSLKELLESCLNSLKSPAEVKKITESFHFKELSDATKLKLFHKMLSFF